jgi:hypothetical protein
MEQRARQGFLGCDWCGNCDHPVLWTSSSLVLTAMSTRRVRGAPRRREWRNRCARRDRRETHRAARRAGTNRNPAWTGQPGRSGTSRARFSPCPAARSWSPWQRRLTPADSRQESTPRRFGRPPGCFNHSRRHVSSTINRGGCPCHATASQASVPRRIAGDLPAYDQRRDRRRAPVLPHRSGTTRRLR